MPALKAIASRKTLATKLEVVCPEDRVLRVRGKKKLEVAATKSFCVKHGIRYHEIPSKIDKEKRKEAWASLRERVLEEKFDLGVVISFGYFLPSSLLKFCCPPIDSNLLPNSSIIVICVGLCLSIECTAPTQLLQTS